MEVHEHHFLTCMPLPKCMASFYLIKLILLQLLSMCWGKSRTMRCCSEVESIYPSFHINFLTHHYLDDSVAILLLGT